MVKPFRFARLPVINFGQGQISGLPEILKKYGRSVLVVTGKNSLYDSGYADKLFNTLDLKGLVYRSVSIPGEPSPVMIDEAVSDMLTGRPDVVVAIGGGSVLDAGKAISAMHGLPHSVTEYLEGVGTREHPGTKIPFIAIPTTSGTGSEATKNAVITQTGRGGFKRSLRHDNFVPDIAIVDPELTLSCSAGTTAASGMDCFTQLTEAYLSDKASEYSDAIAVEGLKSIKTSLLRSYQDGSDIEARTGMSFAALSSGICLANAGLGVVHGFASSVGGLYDIPHGVICGTLMGKANEVNVRELRKLPESQALKKYVFLGKLFLEESGKTDDYYIDGFIDYINSLTSELNLPGFRQYGVDEADLYDICKSTECKNNPVTLNSDQLFEIISARFI